MERDLWTKFKQLVTVSCGPGDNLSKTYIAELLSMLFLCKKMSKLLFFVNVRKMAKFLVLIYVSKQKLQFLAHQISWVSD